MPGSNHVESDFLDRLRAIIQQNISNEMFGVAELAKEAGMSRSNLLRKIKKLAKISASQFMRQVRLQNAMDMLKQTSLTVSEISYKVGFGSTSYFIKCFRDEYGYPPGEVGKRDENESNQVGQSSPTHQLAAIMFTDIEGYTSLMQQGEAKAIAFRNRHREVINAITKKFNGRILQYYGDGTLSTFNSAIDAVRCGIELQLAFREEPRIPVRVGIHSGDILFSEDGIIGDGVNVASRIESMAVPQSVFISEKVYDEVKNQSGIQTISMGIFELKNVDRPIEVFAISNPGMTVPDRDKIRGKVKRTITNSQKEAGIRDKKLGFLWVLLPLAVILLGYILFKSDIFEKFSAHDRSIANKSIAVLPFINDSNDSTNIYFINGLMESTLNNLQRIKDLRVVSRTSVEKYRNNLKSSTEIGRELNVKYLIEGSGQKIGDQILLSIQLIETQSDEHLWSEQYNREVGDIFNLQAEIAKSIADEIEVIITPEEEERIGKTPTDNLVAYDYFLKGYDLLYSRIPVNIEKGITFFKQAIGEDPEFARAYAAIAISYYYLDEGKAEKEFGEQINHYADQALLFDEKLPQSLIAKGLFYIHNEEYNLAVAYLEKSLEYNPNYDLAMAFLVELYVHYIPDTEKYLEYALKGLQVDVGSYDSTTTSFIYLHISNAFLQSGFIDEAEKYINISLVYDPENLYTAYTKPYILFAKNRDIQQLKDRLIDVYKKDTTRMDIMQEVGKIYYYMRDYDSAYYYYNKFTELRKILNLDIYRSENAKIGFVFSKMGMKEESEKFLNQYKQDAEYDPSIYKNLSVAMYYSYKNQTEKAMEHLELFSKNTSYQYLIIPFLKMDPLADNIKELSEFRNILNDMETNFWKRHEEIRARLEAKGLI